MACAPLPNGLKVMVVIYSTFKGGLLSLLKAPRHPPEPPIGNTDDVEVFRADPRFLKLRLLVWGIGFLVAVIVELIWIVLESHGGRMALAFAILGVTLITSAVTYFLIRLDYDMRYYVITDRSLRIRDGVMIINESTFTHANVQNLRILQGPLERLMGIANLQLETAGGAGASSGERPNQLEMGFGRGHEGILRGVANARLVRDRIMERLKQHRDAGLGDPEDHGRAAPGGTVTRGLPPTAMQRLREIRDELRRVAAPRETGSPDTIEP